MLPWLATPMMWWLHIKQARCLAPELLPKRRLLPKLTPYRLRHQWEALRPIKELEMEILAELYPTQAPIQGFLASPFSC